MSTCWVELGNAWFLREGEAHYVGTIFVGPDFECWYAGRMVAHKSELDEAKEYLERYHAKAQAENAGQVKLREPK